MRKQVINHSEREAMILEYLNSHSFATTEEICTCTGVSPATARRDFEALRKKGLVARSHGGIQSISPIAASPAPASSISSYNMLSINTQVDEEKDRIAAYAASKVRENECIFIGSGKTCNLFTSHLRNIDYLTIVTTSLNAVMELIHKSNISIHLLGGDIYLGSNFIETIIPDNELDIYSRLYFDRVFITVDGVDPESGYTIRNRRQIPLYTQLLESSKEFNLLVDSSKFDRRSFVPVFGMEQVHNIITTNGIPQHYVDYYQAHGINLQIT